MKHKPHWPPVTFSPVRYMCSIAVPVFLISKYGCLEMLKFKVKHSVQLPSRTRGGHTRHNNDWSAIGQVSLYKTDLTETNWHQSHHEVFVCRCCCCAESHLRVPGCVAGLWEAAQARGQRSRCKLHIYSITDLCILQTASFDATQLNPTWTFANKSPFFCYFRSVGVGTW